MVLDIKELHEWRFLSKDGSCVLPWYTRPALDVLEGIDLHNKVVFEYGIGMSTIWYAKNAEKVFGVDSNNEWVKNVEETLLFHKIKDKVDLEFTPIESEYLRSIYKMTYLNPNIIVVDGSYRDECTKMALMFAKQHSNRGTLIVLDNWLQPSVEVASQEVQDLVNQHQYIVYPQPGHPDWQTCIITI